MAKLVISLFLLGFLLLYTIWYIGKDPPKKQYIKEDYPQLDPNKTPVDYDWSSGVFIYTEDTAYLSKYDGKWRPKSEVDSLVVIAKNHSKLHGSTKDTLTIEEYIDLSVQEEIDLNR